MSHSLYDFLFSVYFHIRSPADMLIPTDASIPSFMGKLKNIMDKNPDKMKHTIFSQVLIRGMIIAINVTGIAKSS